MKVVILNGARPNDAATDAVNEVLLAELAATQSQVQSFALRDAKIGYCQGDFECWVKTPGVCKIDDDARLIARAMIQSDLVVYLTPVTFGGYSSELKRVLDRTICLVLPFFVRVGKEVHHQKRYDVYPRLVGLGTLPQHDASAEQIFGALLKRNAINFHSPASAARVLVSGEAAAWGSQLKTLFSSIGAA